MQRHRESIIQVNHDQDVVSLRFSSAVYGFVRLAMLAATLPANQTTMDMNQFLVNLLFQKSKGDLFGVCFFFLLSEHPVRQQ